MKDKSAQDLVDVMRGLIRDEVSKTSQMILCEVDHVNSDGTADVLIVPDNKTLIKGVPNNTPHTLQRGDSVYLMKINNQIANSFIIRKSAEKEGGENSLVSDLKDMGDSIRRLEDQYKSLSKQGHSQSIVWDKIYPVGTVYESVDFNFSPSNYFSGRWGMINNGLYENNSMTQPLPLFEDKETPAYNVYRSGIIQIDARYKGFYAKVQDNTISIYTDETGTQLSDWIDIPLPDSVTMSLAGPYFFNVTKKNSFSSLGITGAHLVRKEAGINIEPEDGSGSGTLYPYHSSIKINAATISKQVVFIPPFTKLRTGAPGTGSGHPMFKQNKSETYIRIYLAAGVKIGEDYPIVLEAHLVRWPRRWYRIS